MSKSIFQKHDYKIATIISVHTAVDVLNENNSDEHKGNLIFITSFGYVTAKSIVYSDNIDPTDNPDIISLLQTTIKKTIEILKENNNEEKSESDISFILKDVQIKTYDGHTNNLPLMVLFSDSIQGLTIGNLS